ncbi:MULTISPECIES: hypothetical protein [unclassified Streptomyces]|nr:hypothetical protein OG573_36750 [Streptomyces sp. NBC_01205]
MSTPRERHVLAHPVLAGAADELASLPYRFALRCAELPGRAGPV